MKPLVVNNLRGNPEDGLDQFVLRRLHVDWSLGHLVRDHHLWCHLDGAPWLSLRPEKAFYPNIISVSRFSGLLSAEVDNIQSRVRRGESSGNCFQDTSVQKGCLGQGNFPVRTPAEKLVVDDDQRSLITSHWTAITTHHWSITWVSVRWSPQYWVLESHCVCVPPRTDSVTLTDQLTIMLTLHAGWSYRPSDHGIILRLRLRHQNTTPDNSDQQSSSRFNARGTI